MNRIVRPLLLFFTGFLSLTALTGGIGLMTGWNAPPPEMLEGSPFTGYLVPGLALFALVGGTAGTAFVMLLRRHARGIDAAFAAGVFIFVFETVEVAVIGAPAGIARTLQVFYLSLGAVIVSLARRA